MSRIVCAGLSHQATALHVRERFAVPARDVAARLQEIRVRSGAAEAVLVSTCNRIEVYAAGTLPEGPGALAALLGPLAERAGTPLPADGGYVHADRDAVRHAFRVAAGLDALVVGETQILGQVREAYGLASAAGAAGPALHPLFQRALAVAKELQATTRVGAGRASVAGVAVDLAERVFGDLRHVTALLLGTGDTGHLTLRHLRDAGVRRCLLASQTGTRAAEAAAAAGVEAVPEGGLADAMADADLVVTATAGAGAPVVTLATLREALRRRKQRPLVVIDLGVPRNVDPAAATLDNVFCYDVDGLAAVVEGNLRARAAEVAVCEARVAEAVEAYWHRHGDPDVEATAAALVRALTALGDVEGARLAERLPALPEAVRAEIAAGWRRVAERIAAQAVAGLRRAARNGGAAGLAEAVRALFELGERRE